eukprot:TRINITY_DN2609_c0_g1_i1.p1 TRINITY_DN2609_c0_g1~~TRINITY_DN2609_c0_g1_i1.p1  ORF type:complete len:253 (-),score=23.73 TRINITY_DN2609_c0_g1_i1:282-1013(-)
MEGKDHQGPEQLAQQQVQQEQQHPQTVQTQQTATSTGDLNRIWARLKGADETFTAWTDVKQSAVAILAASVGGSVAGWMRGKRSRAGMGTLQGRAGAARGALALGLKCGMFATVYTGSMMFTEAARGQPSSADSTYAGALSCMLFAAPRGPMATAYGMVIGSCLGFLAGIPRDLFVRQLLQEQQRLERLQQQHDQPETNEHPAQPIQSNVSDAPPPDFEHDSDGDVKFMVQELDASLKDWPKP